MAEAPIMPWATDAFLSDTMDLDAAETGAYALLLMCMWRAGGELPLDHKRLARFARMTPAKWAKTWPSLEAFFHIEGGVLRQGKLQEMLENVREKSKAGKTGARARWRKNKGKGDAVASKPQCESDAIHNHNHEKRDANASHKKGTRLSPDWELPREWGQWAVNEGWPAASVRIEAECFRDYWAGKAGKDATKLDWLGTWRNWIRNDYAKRGPKHGRANNQSAQQRRASEALDAELEYVANRWSDSGGETAAGADAQDPSDGGGSRSQNQNAPVVLLASRR